MNDAPPLIVHVVHRFAIGGLENGLVNLINSLPSSSWRHAVIALTDVDPGFVKRVVRDDVEFVSLRKGPGHALPLYPKLFSLMRSLRPTIVHSRNLAALEATVPAWAAGVPTRIHGEHGRDVNELDGRGRRYQYVRRLYRPFVSRYVALSPDLEHYLHQKVGIPQARIVQIFNGVDTDRFHPPSNGRVAIEGCPFVDRKFWIVGTVGRMEAVKDPANLARAFVRVVRTHPEARRWMRLVLVGEGSQRSQVEAILEAGDARSLAWFAGESDDVPRLMQGLDCFVLPSRAEGVSNVVLEAMACRLPVIATRVGANGELVEDGLTGKLVPPDDSEALASAIDEYFTDPARARRHGKAGRQRVEQWYSLERMVERYHRMYCQMLPPSAIASRARAPHADRGMNG